METLRKPMKRQLNEEERNLTQKGIEKINNEILSYEGDVRFFDYVISTRLKEDFKKKEKEYMYKRAAAVQEIQKLQSIKALTERQLIDGVEVKQPEQVEPQDQEDTKSDS